MTRSPRLVALRRPADGGYLRAVRAIWDSGDVVLPLPEDVAQARRLVAALAPDIVIDEGPAPTGDNPGARLAGVKGPRDSMPAPARPSALPQDTALVVATSGTSGPPKGIVLSHGAVSHAVTASIERLGTEPSDRWLCCLPLHHVAGLLVLLRGEAAPGGTVVLPRFDVDEVGAALEDMPAPTLVSLVPTMLHRLLHAGVDVGRFRTVLLGGAAADPALLRRAAEAGANVVRSYGLTETCGGVVYDGVPLSGVGVAVEPDGRVLVSGPTLLSGCRGGDEPTIAGGWLPTNDVGRWDQAGRLEVRGRLDDVIVTGGENVSATEIARALEQHPWVRHAAVCGVPDVDWGQRVEAWIAAADEDPSQLASVAAVARSSLPPAAVPKRVHLVRALPRTALGKVATAALERTYVLATWPEAGMMAANADGGFRKGRAAEEDTGK